MEQKQRVDEMNYNSKTKDQNMALQNKTNQLNKRKRLASRREHKTVPITQLFRCLIKLHSVVLLKKQTNTSKTLLDNHQLFLDLSSAPDHDHNLCRLHLCLFHIPHLFIIQCNTSMAYQSC